MKYGGLHVYSGEWWHFDGPGAGADRPILNVPVDLAFGLSYTETINFIF